MRSRSLPGRRRRAVAAGVTGALLLSLAAGTIAAVPASAADTTACSPYISLYASDTAGKSWFWRGSTANFGATLISAPEQPYMVATPRELTGLTHYPTIFGANLPNATMQAFGISAETSIRGVTYWNSLVPTNITSYLAPFASPANKNKITADRRGNIFDIQYGALEQWTYDPSTTPGTWSTYSRTLATGWDVYDLIVATDSGVIYARKSNGDLYRWEVEPVSHRGLTGGQKVGTGFNRYKSITTAGGNTLIGILPTAGVPEVYRWDPSASAWSVQRVPLQVPGTTNFSGYVNVWADPRTCASPITSSVAVPVIEPPTFAPVGVSERKTVGGVLKGVDFAVVNTHGQLAVHHQHDQDGTALDSSAFIAAGSVFSGKPQVWQVPYSSATDLKTNVMALQRPSGVVRQYIQSGTDWTTPGSNQGGITNSPPTSVRLGASWVAVFMTSADGKLFLSDSAWENKGGGTYSIRPNLLSWRGVALPPGVTLAGSVATVALSDTRAAVVATDTTGSLWEAEYTAAPLGVGPVSSWKSLGGSGFVDSPTVVAYPDQTIRVFARDATGVIVTQLQRADGSFPGAWRVVGEPPVVTKGSPSAVLSYQGRTYVFALEEATGTVWGAQERSQACGEFDWWPAYDGVNGKAKAAPTAFLATGTGGTLWGFASYDVDFNLILQRQGGGPGAPTVECSGGGSASAARSGTSRMASKVTFPTFESLKFPAPKP